MEIICKQSDRVREQGLFKSVLARQILLQDLLPRIVGACGTLQPDFESLPDVDSVDVFISHSWSVQNWTKFLCICHYLNLNCATCASIIACIVTALALCFKAGHVCLVASMMSVNDLFQLLVCFPMLVFALTFFFANTLSKGPSMWFDRLCVNQTKGELKMKALEAIPFFVAHSKRMLILWDETFLERLWCCYEIAVFAKSSGKPSSKDFMPTWLPLWVLSCLFIIWLGCAMLFLNPIPPQYDHESRITLFIQVFNYWFSGLYVFAIISILFAYFCLRKLESHTLMLDQMSRFDLRAAKCALESDRDVIEEHILDLFDEALEAPLRVAIESEDANQLEQEAPLVSRETMKEIRWITSYPNNDQIIDQFNAYVRGPLCDSLRSSMGSATEISWIYCMVSCLPWCFGTFAYFLACDGGDCKASAARQGYASVNEYMYCNAAAYVLFPLFNGPCYFKLTLQMANVVVSQVQDRKIQMILTALGGMASAAFLFALNSAVIALLWVNRIATQFSLMWMLAFVISLFVTFALNWYLFVRRKVSPTSRCICSAWDQT